MVQSIVRSIILHIDQAAQIGWRADFRLMSGRILRSWLHTTASHGGRSCTRVHRMSGEAAPHIASHGGQGCIQRHRTEGTEGTGCPFRSATHHAARTIETAGGTARSDAVPPKNAELPSAWMLACHARPDLCALCALRAMPLFAKQRDSHCGASQSVLLSSLASHRSPRAKP